jgi:hypothetical protein
MLLGMNQQIRYAISTEEEVWVRACYKFFEEYGFWDWYQIPPEKAFMVIMKHTKGQGNPLLIKQRVNKMYEDAGVKNL